ncbi:hypothetical protein BK146_32440 [Paenibacillus sp. FSL R7-0333]|nr:hypothetical protein BK146_32440 [Paenibacillus sp. FSL R7-0333]
MIMNTESRKSEDELLVNAIHKTMGQMEQLKHACLRLSVNADEELALFMQETRRLLDKVQTSGQEPEKEWNEPEEEVAAFIKSAVQNAVRPAAAPFVSMRKPAFAQRKAGRFIQKRSPQVKRKRTSSAKRSRTEHVRATGERTRSLRQPSVPEPKVIKPKQEPQSPKKKLESQPPKPKLELQLPKPKLELKSQPPKKTTNLKASEPVEYSGIITSSNLKRSF